MARDNGTGSELLYAEIDALQSETTLQLKQRWKALYSTEPPPRASRDLLTRGRLPPAGTRARRAQRLDAPPARADC
jgi:hypothetical protein